MQPRERGLYAALGGDLFCGRTGCSRVWLLGYRIGGRGDRQDPLLYFHSSVLAVVDSRDGAASLNGCKAACLTGLKMKSEVPGLPARAMARLPFGDLTSAGVPPSLRSSIF